MRSDAPLTLNAWLRWDVVREKVDEIRPRSVLELGVGSGAVGSRLASACTDYVGVEPDEVSRGIAEARMPAGAELVAGDAEVGDRSFDLVCAFEVLEHIEDDRSALEAWVRWIEPSGWILLSMPAFSARFGPWDERVGHFRRYDPDDLHALLAGAGLVEIDVRAVGFPLGPALEAGRNVIARRRPATSSAESRTASSGRLLQPSGGGWVTEAVTFPFRRIQRRFPDRGTTLVAAACRPG